MKVLGLGAAGGALMMAPAVAQTVTHARGLKRKEREAEAKERASGQRYPELGPAPGFRSMGDLMERLKAVPFNPKPYNGITSTLLFSMADVIPMLLECRRSTCGMVYGYPEPFRKVVIESEDGTPISGVVAIHDDGRPRPALLMVHGLFGSQEHLVQPAGHTLRLLRVGLQRDGYRPALFRREQALLGCCREPVAGRKARTS